MNILTMDRFAHLTPEQQQTVHEWLEHEELLHCRVTRMRIMGGTAVEIQAHSVTEDGDLEVRFNDAGEPAIVQRVLLHECKTPPPWKSW